MVTFLYDPRLELTNNAAERAIKPFVMLNAVLIPFRDVIISDGLVLPYNVAFGRNYSSKWKDIYMAAKKSGTLHKTL